MSVWRLNDEHPRSLDGRKSSSANRNPNTIHKLVVRMIFLLVSRRYGVPNPNRSQVLPEPLSFQCIPQSIHPLHFVELSNASGIIRADLRLRTVRSHPAMTSHGSLPLQLVQPCFHLLRFEIYFACRIIRLLASSCCWCFEQTSHLESRYGGRRIVDPARTSCRKRL